MRVFVVSSFFPFFITFCTFAINTRTFICTAALKCHVRNRVRRTRPAPNTNVGVGQVRQHRRDGFGLFFFGFLYLLEKVHFVVVAPHGVVVIAVIGNVVCRWSYTTRRRCLRHLEHFSFILYLYMPCTSFTKLKLDTLYVLAQAYVHWLFCHDVVGGDFVDRLGNTLQLLQPDIQILLCVRIPRSFVLCAHVSLLLCDQVLQLLPVILHHTPYNTRRSMAGPFVPQKLQRYAESLQSRTNSSKEYFGDILFFQLRACVFACPL